MKFIMNFIDEFHSQSSEQMRYIFKNIVFTFIMLCGTQHCFIWAAQNFHAEFPNKIGLTKVFTNY